MINFQDVTNHQIVWHPLSAASPLQGRTWWNDCPFSGGYQARMFEGHTPKVSAVFFTIMLSLAWVQTDIKKASVLPWSIKIASFAGAVSGQKAFPFRCRMRGWRRHALGFSSCRMQPLHQHLGWVQSAIESWKRRWILSAGLCDPRISKTAWQRMITFTEIFNPDNYWK